MNKLNYNYQGPLLKNLGRYHINAQREAQMLTFSASGFEISFYGQYLEGEFIATEGGKPDGEGAIAVVIDDQPFNKAHKIVLSKPREVYVLASKLPCGKHRVRVYKRTESACSLTGWHYLKTDGEFLPVEQVKKLKIEFYGDSITAGNGVEGVVGDDIFETRTENGLLSYAALASEKLQADFSLIAIGGYPLYKSPWTGAASIKTIPQMISFADYDWGTTLNNFIPWDNQKFIPDIVVINLGTNDDQYLLSLSEEERRKEEINFCKEIRTFIARLFTIYPQCKIIMTIGMIAVQSVEALIKKVASEYAQNVYYYKFNSLAVGGYMPSGGHPNQKMHEYAAEELVSFIKSII